TNGANGTKASLSHRPRRTVAWRATERANSCASRVFPCPGSPVIITSCCCPPEAMVQAAPNRLSSSVRPSRGTGQEGGQVSGGGGGIHPLPDGASAVALYAETSDCSGSRRSNHASISFV